MSSPLEPQRRRIRKVAGIAGGIAGGLVGFIVAGAVGYHFFFFSPIRSLGEPADAEKTFSIQFPDGWTTKEHYLDTVLMGNSPLDGPDDTFSENVNVVVRKFSREMTEGDIEGCHEAIAANATEFDLIEKGDVVVDGEKGQWHITSFSMEGKRIRNMQYFVTKGRLLFVITCTATPETFESHKSAFESIVKTFRFR